MPSILDEFPYPWPDRTAQELHLKLTNLHPSPQQAVMVAQKVGVDTSYLFANQPVVFVWHDILDLAAQSGLTRHLVVVVRDLLNNQSPHRQFFNDVLAAIRRPIEAEPRNMDGTAIFIRSDETITEPEALLFRDDLTLETGRIPAFIQTLELLNGLKPAVCRIEAVFGSMDGGVGTGFRVGPDLVLTNWHVLHHPSSGDPAASVTLEFGFEDDGRGGTVASTAVKGNVSTIVTDMENDWAVIGLEQPIDDAFRVVKLSDAVDPVLGEPAYIVQHPGGRRKRLGYVRNQVSDFDDRVVHYLTDTEPGSSGSPVFNADGRLIGLHHVGGTPQTVVGRPPMTKNEGIRIPNVVHGLADRGIVVP